ncbi:YbaK/EbsC family protein [Gallaecimonas sp. GXIMD4217]|uniref:aminoacyl-tRNA deacylase n=1 Tax=Gallaecimonas sp. GXIMD4217 TaxID=3131927 RepID=UPI00311B2CE3
MGMSTSLRRYLESRNLRFETVNHPYSEGAMQTAIAGHVPMDQMAKAVVVEDHEGRHMMAVLPAGRRLDLHQLSDWMHRDFHLVPEWKLESMFRDCKPGAIPAFGDAYNMETVVDDELLDQNDVYVEAGDHQDLLHINGDAFRSWAIEHKHARFSRRHDWTGMETRK